MDKFSWEKEPPAERREQGAWAGRPCYDCGFFRSNEAGPVLLLPAPKEWDCHMFDRSDAPDAHFEKYRIHYNRGAILAFVIGLLWRYYFIYYAHTPSRAEYIFSDMETHVLAANQLSDPAYIPNIADTIYPAGCIFFAGIYILDPSWKMAVDLQFLLSAVLPLLVYALGRDLFGRRTAVYALIASSLYFPFIDCAGFFLTENPFMFFNLLSLWLLIRSLRTQSAWGAAAAALLSGIFLGVAVSFKSFVVISAGLIGVYLVWLAWRQRWRGLPLRLSAALIGLLAVMAPLTVRATRLNDGRFCLGSSTGAMNILQGHHGNIGWVHFVDPKRNTRYKFGSAASLQKHYDPLYLPCGPYDGAEIMAETRTWIQAHPIEALRLSVEHVFDLFINNEFWPGNMRFERRWMTLFQELFLIAILFPVLLLVVDYRWKLLKPEASGVLLALLPLAGVMSAAFIAIGEIRYRVPFDPYLILLASFWYATRPAAASAPVAAAGSALPQY